MAAVDIGELEAKVRQMYRQVADLPDGPYHFEMGRALRPGARRGIADIVTVRPRQSSATPICGPLASAAPPKRRVPKPHRGHRPDDRGNAAQSVRVPVHPGPQRQHHMRGAKHQRTCGQTGPLSRNPPVNNRRETQ